jgi:hypothetical protein
MKLLKLGCVFALGLARSALAEDAAPPAPPTPAPVLQGRPDAHVVNDDALGPEFRSLAAGIALRPPAGGKEFRRGVGADDVVQFNYEKQSWQLKVSRLVLPKPAPLVTDREKDKEGLIRQGLLETMAQQLKTDTGGAEILRQDPINVASTPIGMIAARYSFGTDTLLTQRALVQGDDGEQVYFIIDSTTPAPRTGALDQNPEMRKVVDLFGKVVESVQLLDQTRLVRDQFERLSYTRALLVNITEPKIKSVLVPERWFRLIREGKDFGFTYVVEEVASGVPRKNDAPLARAGNVVGVRVGVHSRTYPEPGVQRDSQSWSWVAMDKKQEEWSSLNAIQNANAKEAKGQKITSSEWGDALWRIKPIKDGMARDPNNPGVRQIGDWKLTVTVIGTGTDRTEPATHDLPVFYLPRALDHLLPRLLPRSIDSQDKGYMFASYVSDQKEIIRRFIDVGKEGEYILNGTKIHAVPIRDRVGLEGSVTTHYVSPEGDYLGSINTDSKLTVLPADYATLEKMWKDVKNARPGDVEMPGTRMK